jgi:hypothetical protein
VFNAQHFFVELFVIRSAMLDVYRKEHPHARKIA